MVIQSLVGLTTIVRDATQADLPALVAMGRRFRAETVYRDRLAEHVDQMTRTAHALIEGAGTVIFVAERDGVLIGMLGGGLFTHPLAGSLYAGELFWWVDPDARGAGLRLLRSFERWARAHGAVCLQMVAPTPDVEQLYTRLAFTQVETTYQKELR